MADKSKRVLNEKIEFNFNTKRDFKRFDVLFAVLVIGLCVFGLIIIPSAGAGLGIEAKKFNMQKVWVVTGVFIMIAAAILDYEFICKFTVPMLAVNLLLLAVVIVMNKVRPTRLDFREIGYDFSFGSVSIMPSEFAKIFTIVGLAKVIDTFREKINNFFVLAAIVGYAGLSFALVFLEPALSASLVLLFITIVMLYVGRLKLRYFLIAIAIAAPALAFLYYDVSREEPFLVKHGILKEYQVEDRLMPFLGLADDPDATFQTNRSIDAIQTGKLYGNGLRGNKIYVPESANDFIFAVIASEFGFFGSMTVIAVGFLIVFKCLLIAWKSEVFLGKLIAAGVGAMFGFHIFVNIGVATGLLPNTGITFPFISTGGSSIWVNMASAGLVLNVGMTKPKSMFDD